MSEPRLIYIDSSVIVTAMTDDHPDVIDVTPEIRRRAAILPPASLRTLDAIHVATALVAEAYQFATLDERQKVAAEEAFLKTVAPFSGGATDARSARSSKTGRPSR